MGPYTVGADSANASIELHTTRFLKSGDGRTDGTDGDAIREREENFFILEAQGFSRVPNTAGLMLNHRGHSSWNVKRRAIPRAFLEAAQATGAAWMV